MGKKGDRKQNKSGKEEIDDYYSKKRVLIKENLNEELKEEINEFDKYYKDL